MSALGRNVDHGGKRRDWTGRRNSKAQATGVVTGWIDLRGLLKFGEVTSPDAVLNGIAYDAATKRLFVTGKLWPKLFEITLVPK